MLNINEEKKIIGDEAYIPLGEKIMPKTFLDCIHSQKTSIILKSLIPDNIYDGIPNIILYGREGSGKYTRLMILLKNYFKNICDPYKFFIRAVDVETGSFVDLPNSKNKLKNKVIIAYTSKSHCEIDLSQANSNKVIIKFLEYYSKSKNINLNIQKYIILRHFEFLKKETQNSLRRIVETCQSNLIFMITINSLSNLINPLRSRFICVSVLSPSHDESIQIINSICIKNNLKISPKKIELIIEKSLYGSSGTINLRELLLTLEGSCILSENINLGLKSLSSKLKVSKIYTTERNEASDLLIKEVKKGNREEIRNIIYKNYEYMKNDFILIITGDFFRKMLNIIDNEKLKKDFIYLTSKWNTELNKNHIYNHIFQAEAYIYAVCDLLNF